MYMLFNIVRLSVVKKLLVIFLYLIPSDLAKSFRNFSPAVKTEMELAGRVFLYVLYVLDQPSYFGWVFFSWVPAWLGLAHRQ